jgi:tRNA 5-methylaminomethyl-2-thiouridine biosynthesis bifunctional protein
MREQLEHRVPQGAGWQSCEVDNRGHDPGRWPAALVRPAALVHAWLAEAQALGALQAVWNAPVGRLCRTDRAASAPGWQALGTDGRWLAQAPVVVVAAAYGCHALLAEGASLDADALPLRPVHGQLSLGALQGQPLSPRPQRDNGVFVPCYEDSGLPPAWPARVWTMGATYERGSDSCALSDAAHRRNGESLQAMHPAAAQRLHNDLDQGRLLGWAQVRCASLDRLPLMGPVPDVAALAALMAAAGARRGHIPLSAVPRLPGLHVLTALGSRGLTLSHWCATQLAAQLDGQRVALEDQDQDLLAALDPARFAWRRIRRQVQPLPDPTVSPA